MTTIEKLTAEFNAASDRAARFVGAEYQRHVLQLEREICDHLASQPNGTITVGRIQWALEIAIVEGERLRWFKTTPVDRDERRCVDDDDGGHTFAKRQLDINPPVSAQHWRKLELRGELTTPSRSPGPRKSAGGLR
jgi:hypothetical protein